MEQIIIRTNDKKKAQALLKFLKALDFIENVTASELSTSSPKGKSSEQDFFDMAGLWAGRDITLESIRGKAWPSRI